MQLKNIIIYLRNNYFFVYFLQIVIFFIIFAAIGLKFYIFCYLKLMLTLQPILRRRFCRRQRVGRLRQFKSGTGK